MFGSRKPKIIANYDDDEDASDTQDASRATAPKSRPQIIKPKTRIKPTFKVARHDDSHIEDNEDDLDSIVIRPAAAAKKAARFKSSASFSTRKIKRPEAPLPSLATDSDLNGNDGSRDMESATPQYSKEYIDELKRNSINSSFGQSSTTPDQDTNASTIVIHGDDDELSRTASLIHEEESDGDIDMEEISPDNYQRHVKFSETIQIQTIPPNPSQDSIFDSQIDDGDNEEEEEEDFISLEPEVLAEEKDLLETRIYNEYDMEEGVEMLDEDLALDKKTQKTQEELRRQMIEEAIEDVENDTGDEDTDLWLRNQLHHSTVAHSGETDEDIDMADKSRHSKKNGEKKNKIDLSSIKLPRLEAVLAHVHTNLDKLTAEKETIQSEITQLSGEIEKINEKQALVQEKINQAGANYQAAPNDTTGNDILMSE